MSGDHQTISKGQTLTKFEAGQVILVDKPLHWTSFDVVNKIRHKIRHTFQIKKIKVGHAGTLDPLATGLLIVCTGKMTKSIETFQNQEKVYTGTIILGGTTPTYDAEFEPDKVFPTGHITNHMLFDTAARLTGEIEQVPPVYSAVKVKGQTAYSLARKGKDVELASRKVHIYEFDITDVQMPVVSFRVRCSKGTYIRSLADDFGRMCGSGAYLGSLRRESIGDYDVSRAMSVEGVVRWIETGVVADSPENVD